MLPVVAILAAAVLFGTTGLSQALGPETSTPLAVGFSRMAIGGTALGVIALLLSRLSPSRSKPTTTGRGRTVMLSAIAGTCMFAYQPLFFTGVAHVGVAVGTVVALGSAPLIAGAIEAVMNRRVPSPLWLTTTVLAIIGVALLATGDGGATSASALGLASAIGAGAMFAGFSIAQRALLTGGWTPLSAIGTAGAVAGALSLISLTFVDVAWLARPAGIAMAVWLGLGATTLAYALYTFGLTKVSGATAATLTLTEPLVATVLGVSVLGESLTWPQVIGLIAIGTGIAILSTTTRRSSSPTLHERESYAR